MFRLIFRSSFTALSLFIIGLSASSANAAEKVHTDKHSVVRWKAIGIIAGPASPLRTPSYLPRPLVQGELVEMNFTINTAAKGLVYSTLAEYPGAIRSVKVTGSDWLIRMRAPLGSGYAEISNDDPDYGDSLALIANTPLLPGKTWYQVEIDMRNPGGPNPGIGPWQPFTSLALPRMPPPLGLMPSHGFYLGARRDQPGQAFDGDVYFGEILSIGGVKSDDD